MEDFRWAIVTAVFIEVDMKSALGLITIVVRIKEANYQEVQ